MNRIDGRARGAPDDSPAIERGSVAVELAVLVPILLMLVGMFAVGYRVWAVRASALSAAEAGARAASMAPTASAGEAMARSIVAANLAGLGVDCLDQRIGVDASGLALPAGQEGWVGVSVSCRVSFHDLVLPGSPGSMTVHADARERVDTYRERGS